MAVLTCAVGLSACGSGPSDGAGAAKTSSAQPRQAGSFAQVERAAKGQTVRWWMYGGDPRINAFVDDHVAPAALRRGVRVKRIAVDDTVEAVNRVIAERRAQKTSGGGVDLIWINGQNFAAGKQVGLWRRDWASALPNARLVDRASPLVKRDFGVAVDGQESPWSGAALVFARDPKRTPEAPKDLDGLLAYAKAHPGRVAYPAPPDFTGSAFLRQVIAQRGSQQAGLDYLRALKPLSYRKGGVYPKSEQELTQLFADGKVDFTLSYNASFVALGVRQGLLPKSTRPFVLGGASLQNVSFVTIPANAAHPEAAQVLADVLLEPDVQAAMQDPAILGVPTVLDPAKLTPRQAGALTRRDSPYRLDSLGTPLLELPAGQVGKLDAAWRREILR